MQLICKRRNSYNRTHTQSLRNDKRTIKAAFEGFTYTTASQTHTHTDASEEMKKNVCINEEPQQRRKEYGQYQLKCVNTSIFVLCILSTAMFSNIWKLKNFQTIKFYITSKHKQILTYPYTLARHIFLLPLEGDVWRWQSYSGRFFFLSFYIKDKDNYSYLQTRTNTHICILTVHMPRPVTPPSIPFYFDIYAHSFVAATIHNMLLVYALLFAVATNVAIAIAIAGSYCCWWLPAIQENAIKIFA